MLRSSSTRATSGRRLRRLLRCRPSPKRNLLRARNRPLRSPSRSPVQRKKSLLRIVEVRMDSSSTAAAESLRKPAARSLAGLPLGEIMLAHGTVTREKLDEALAAQAERGGRIGEVLISLNACS